MDPAFDPTPDPSNELDTALERLLGDIPETASKPSNALSAMSADEQSALRDTLRRHLMESEAGRKGHVDLVQTYRRTERMDGYAKEELLRPDAQSIRTPLTRARVDQAHASVYGSLALTPALSVLVPPGEDGTLAQKLETLLNEEWERGEGEVALKTATRDPFVATVGYLKASVAQDEDGVAHLDHAAVAMEDLFLNPHDVRDLAQCGFVAQRFYETYGTLLDMALEGTFDEAALRGLSGYGGRDEQDGGAVDRALHDLGADSGFQESRMVETFEAYVMHRSSADEKRELWRVVFARPNLTLLRIEKWGDGLPFFPVRHDPVSETLYAPSYAALLRDLQYVNDMLISGALERDRMALSPQYLVSPFSSAWDTLKEREEAEGYAYFAPGEVISAGPDEVKVMAFDPAHPAVAQRIGMNQQMADSATVPNIPMQTTRAATEIRYAASQISEKESSILKAMRRDLARYLEYTKRLAWTYLCIPATDGSGMKFIPHGSKLYGPVGAAQVLSLRVEMRGTTTRSDKMLQQQALGFLTQQLLPLLEKEPMYRQGGLWPRVYAILRRACELLDIPDFETFLGPPPVNDPLEHQVSPEQERRAVQLAALRGGRSPEEFGLMGGQMSGTEQGPYDGMPQNVPLTPGEAND